MSDCCKFCGEPWERHGTTCNPIRYGPVRLNPQITKCDHINKRVVGYDKEGLGDIIVYWCPTCGGMKRTMTNWRYTDYNWELPTNGQKA